MSHKRNTQGLKDAAKTKRSVALTNAHQAIDALLENQQAINFNKVSRVAKVSKAWLYRQPELREKIYQLRDHQQAENKFISIKQLQAKEAKIAALSARLQSIRAENLKLKKQIEKIYGKLCEVKAS